MRNMEMPCPCDSCGEWFDLHDGRRSITRPGTVICRECRAEENDEAEEEEEEEEDDFDPDTCPVCGEDVAGHDICPACFYVLLPE